MQRCSFQFAMSLGRWVAARTPAMSRAGPRHALTMAVLACGPVAVSAQVPPPPASEVAQPPAPPGEPSADAAAPVSALRPIQPPADPVAAKAFSVLETHCARCHQGGRLKGAAPSAGFGNILRLDEVARDPALVRPGNPDGSPLVTHILRRLMPFDVYQSRAGDERDASPVPAQPDNKPSLSPSPSASVSPSSFLSPPAPSADDIQALRSWIARLSPVSACAGRSPVTAAALSDAVAKVAAARPADAPRLRFISLAHLHNACASGEEMAVWRQAVAVILNGLSWKPAPSRFDPIDDQRTLFAVDLDAIGWVPAHWDRITRGDPFAAGVLAPLPDAVRAPFASELPIVRADWFANIALRAPLYYDLLGLPVLDSEVGKLSHSDLDGSRRSGAVTRQAVPYSQFSRLGRVIERIKHPYRMFWSTYEAIARDAHGRDAVEPHLPGPAEALHDARLGLFALPNGFPAFFAANARGLRTDTLAPDIARGSVAGHHVLRPGLDCAGCHRLGPLTGSNEAALSDETGRLIASDRAATRSAYMRAALDPDAALDGVAPVTSLARAYRRPVDLARAAAELGIEAARLVQLADGTGPGATLARRVVQASVPRAEFESRFEPLRQALSLRPDGENPDAAAGDTRRRSSPAAQALAVAETADPGPQLVIVSDKATYRSGDTLSLIVTPSMDCHLTLISVDQKGRGTVIYPSDFERSSLLLAGREVRIPAQGAPYTFRLKDTGRESVVALCSTAGIAIDGIRHDFERQRFTDLGDYAVFLAQALASDAPPGQAEPTLETAGKAPRRGSRDRGTSEGASRPRADQVARTAILIEIK